MSLVNDMLNDLEHRRAASKNNSEYREWVVGQAASPVSKRINQRIFVYAVLIALLLIFFAWQYKTISDSQITTGTVFATPVQNNEPLSPELVDTVNKKKGLSKITFRQTDEGASVLLGVAPETPYTIRRRAAGLTIVLQGVLPKLGDRVIEPVAPVETFSVDELEGATEVMLNVRGDFYHEVSRQVNAKAQLIVTIVPDAGGNKVSVSEINVAKTNMTKTSNVITPIAETTKTPSPVNVIPPAGLLRDTDMPEKKQQKKNKPTVASVKKSTTLTPRQKDEKVAQKVAALMAKGQYAEAETRLKALLQQQKTAPKSLNIYLSLLLSQRRFEQAQHELEQLPEQERRHPSMMVMQARLYLYRGAAQKSIDLLESAQPRMHQFPTYYELLAQSAQRVERYTRSEQIYRELLKVDAGRGDWWVGLGVSLDAQGKAKAAATVYQRALHARRITPSLKTYAQQRLSVL